MRDCDYNCRLSVSDQEIREAAEAMLTDLLKEVVIYPGCRLQMIWQNQDPLETAKADGAEDAAVQITH